MAEDASDLDDLVRRVDPDRWLSSRFIPDAQARADVLAIYAFDHELARAPRVASNPLLGEIRLTWWREALDEIFEGRPTRRHPTVQALAEAVARHGLSRELLETMIDARYRELDPAPMRPEEAAAWARDTGGLAAELAARILDPAADTAAANAGGAAWALARRAKTAPDLASAADEARRAAKRAAGRLSHHAFPAVAHAALAGGELGRRLRITLAVALGRI